MSLYDALDIIRDINDEAYVYLIQVLSDSGLVNTIKNSIDKKVNALQALETHVSVSSLLTDIQYEDLKDRLQ